MQSVVWEEGRLVIRLGVTTSPDFGLQNSVGMLYRSSCTYPEALYLRVQVLKYPKTLNPAVGCLDTRDIQGLAIFLFECLDL